MILCFKIYPCCIAIDHIYFVSCSAVQGYHKRCNSVVLYNNATALSRRFNGIYDFSVTILVCILKITQTESHWSERHTGNVLNTCSGGALFESQVGHRLS
jgi:hypothetical protein